MTFDPDKEQLLFEASLADEIDLKIFGGMRKFLKEVTLFLIDRLLEKTPIGVEKTSPEMLAKWYVEINGQRIVASAGVGTLRNQTEDFFDNLRPRDKRGRFVKVGIEKVEIGNTAQHAYVWDKGAFVPPDPGPSEQTHPDKAGKILVKGGFNTVAPRGLVDVSVEETQLKFFGLGSFG